MQRDLTLILMIFFAPSVYSENGLEVVDADLQPEFVIQTNDQAIEQFSGNGVEAGKLKNILTNDRPEFNQNNNVRGREFKAESAERDSNTGKAMAAATGGVLIATGSRMLPSIDLAVRIAGAELILKGTMELIQAGADSGTQAQNQGQKNLLLDSANDLGQELNGGNFESLLTPDGRAALRGAGIEDPDDFARRVMDGQYNTPQSAFQALGLEDPGSIPSEILDAASKIQGGQFNQALAQVHGQALPSDKLTVDENGGTSASSGRLTGAAGASSSADSESAAHGDLIVRNPAGTSNIQGLSGKSKPADAGRAATGSFGSWDFTKVKKPTQQERIGHYNQLLELGIRKKKKGQNIFTLARYRYRRYREWRRLKMQQKPKVVTRRVRSPKEPGLELGKKGARIGRR